MQPSIPACTSCSGCGSSEETKDTNCTKSCGQEGQACPRQLVIDYFYLDSSICCRTEKIDSALNEALHYATTILDAMGITVIFNKVKIDTQELAEKYHFTTSPTLRVNGWDVLAKFSRNEPCGDFFGTSIDCRVWQDQQPPTDELVQAILAEAIAK